MFIKYKNNLYNISNSTHIQINHNLKEINIYFDDSYESCCTYKESFFLNKIDYCFQFIIDSINSGSKIIDLDKADL